MNFKNTLNKLFEYKPTNNKPFIIPSSYNELPTNKSTKKVNIYENFDKNFEYLKVKYNLLINSDIVTREFELSIARILKLS